MKQADSTVWLSVAEAAKRLKKTEKEIRAAAREGVVEFRDQGKAMQIAERDLWRIDPPPVTLNRS